jgi:hypothetical protein
MTNIEKELQLNIEKLNRVLVKLNTTKDIVDVTENSCVCNTKWHTELIKSYKTLQMKMVMIITDIDKICCEDFISTRNRHPDIKEYMSDRFLEKEKIECFGVIFEVSQLCVPELQANTRLVFYDDTPFFEIPILEYE